MLLRLILAGLAMGMNPELPSVRDVACWAESVRSWAGFNPVDLKGCGVGVAGSAGSAVPCPSADADAAFQAVVAGVIEAFASDRAAGSVAPGNGVEADAAFQAVVAGTIEAFASDRAAVVGPIPAPAAGDVSVAEMAEPLATGLPEGEGQITVIEVDAAAVEPGSLATIDRAVIEVVDEGPDRSERLASAVRLTRDAAQAWAAVIRGPADEAGCGR